MNINIPIRRFNGVEKKVLPTGEEIFSVKFLDMDDDHEHRVNFVPVPKKEKPMPDIERITE